MNGKIHKAFSKFHADQTLVQKTLADISGRKQKHIPIGYKLTPIMLAFVLFILGGVYITPVSYISIDINPSIELSLNAFKIVIKAEADNVDGQTILNTVNLNNLNYIEAMEKLDLADSFADYSNSYTEVTVISNSVQSSNNMIAGINSSNFSGENVSCHLGNSELKTEAEHNGLSFGKYRAYSELQAIDDSITVDDIHHLSMAEIRQLIENDDSANEDNVDEDNVDAVDNPGNGHGNGHGNQHGNQHGKN